MLSEEIKALQKARMESSDEALASAKILYESKSYKGAANRSYYAIFHAMRAMLAFDGIDMKHHSGIISEFRRLYIKTGIFETKLSNIISELFEIRTDSDYDDFFIISKSDVERQIKNAEYFTDKIKYYLENN